MTEQDPIRNDDEVLDPSGGGDSVTETAGGTPSARVRDVIGRRGYDEGEDETANEDEEH